MAANPTSQDEVAPSWQSSVLGGLVRSTTYTVKRFGLSGKDFHRMMTKTAFMNIGKRSTLNDASAPPLRDSHRLIWEKEQRTNMGKYTWTTRLLSEFTKSSVLGVTVFGLYEYLILKRINKEKASVDTQQGSLVYVYRQNRNDTHQVSARIPTQVSTHTETSTKLLPLSYHMGAGALVGAVQSVVLDGWDIVSYWVHRQRYRQLHDGHAPGLLSSVNHSLVLRRVVHHSLGYMTLFGTYECMRRQGQNQVGKLLTSGDPRVAEHLDWLFRHQIIGTRVSHDNKQELYDLTGVSLLLSFGAGGFAGQAHSIVSHYLRQFRKVTDHSHHKVRHPALSATCVAFLPTAISFMAFQYGGELTERMLGLND